MILFSSYPGAQVGAVEHRLMHNIAIRDVFETRLLNHDTNVECETNRIMRCVESKKEHLALAKRVIMPRVRVIRTSD